MFGLFADNNKIFLIFLIAGIALQFFMKSYLLRKNVIDRSIFSMYSPTEILSQFKNHTKKSNSILYYLYHAEIVLIVLATIFMLLAGINKLNN